RVVAVPWEEPGPDNVRLDPQSGGQSLELFHVGRPLLMEVGGDTARDHQPRVPPTAPHQLECPQQSLEPLARVEIAEVGQHELVRFDPQQVTAGPASRPIRSLDDADDRWRRNQGALERCGWIPLYETRLMPTAENDHSIAVPKQGTELVVDTFRAGVQRQQLPEDPSWERAPTGDYAHRIFELRDERHIGQDHLGYGRCECRHGVIVEGKTDVDHEDGVGPTPAEESREARDILPRPIPHERVHGE